MLTGASYKDELGLALTKQSISANLRIILKSYFKLPDSCDSRPERSAIRLVLKDIKQAHHVVGESQDDRRDVEQEVPMPTAASTRSQDKKTRKKKAS